MEDSNGRAELAAALKTLRAGVRGLVTDEVIVERASAILDEAARRRHASAERVARDRGGQPLRFSVPEKVASRKAFNGWMNSHPKLPPTEEQLLAVVLAIHRVRTSRSDAQLSSGDVLYWRQLYRAAASTPSRTVDRNPVPGVGQPLTAELDPFDLGVHKAITVDPDGRDSALPAYVPRAHDAALAEVVAAAAAGTSRLVVLVGDSSTGKTRALWEALAPLRDQGGWRLWHPRSPNRRAALDELVRVRPRTVVWLNEAQEYLGGDNRAGDEDAAVALRDLLTDDVRGPVLMVGTLWRSYYTVLCRPHASQARELLENSATTAVLEVPASFADADPDALTAAAETDARFAYARERAEYGRITQYLAGGPELLRRYDREFSTAARSIVQVAMDARRMGHRNAIPYGLLAEAAHVYMTPGDWNTVAATDDWLKKALTEAERPCKGADGALTRIITPPVEPSNRTRPTTKRGGSTYLLADYLDQRARVERADIVPPIAFWAALARHAHPQNRDLLGGAAWRRGLYRAAAQLWIDAIGAGTHICAPALIEVMHKVQPNDRRPATWVVERYALTEPHRVANLLTALLKAEFGGHARDLADRTIPTVDIENPNNVAFLLDALREAGLGEHAHDLADRAAPTTDVDNVAYVSVLLHSLSTAELGKHARDLADRAGLTLDTDDPDSVYRLRVTTWEAELYKTAGIQDYRSMFDHRGRITPRWPRLRSGTRPLQSAASVHDCRFGREPDGADAKEWTWDDLLVPE
ncbi:hypothetical protein ACFVJ5_07520 [Nocardia sp. NPDC127606]|uniref:hypothetical protein n=1 Tax=Nocardia sp. NPDC127606 TaxID=3345406 RepID=UPI0036299EE8